jgi:hypothetical protein
MLLPATLPRNAEQRHETPGMGVELHLVVLAGVLRVANHHQFEGLVFGSEFEWVNFSCRPHLTSRGKWKRPLHIPVLPRLWKYDTPTDSETLRPILCGTPQTDHLGMRSLVSRAGPPFIC